MQVIRLRPALVASLCIVALNVLPSPVLSESGWPLKATIELNAETHNSHSLWFHDPRSPLSSMELRVTPEVNDANEVLTWEVDLLRYSPRTGKHGDNLLAEKVKGLQPFVVIPADVEGHGYYPRQREIRRNGFRCVITVLGGETKASRVTPNLTVFESLRLEIELDVDHQEGSATPQPQSRHRRRSGGRRVCERIARRGKL
jgi:hypothetical protein